MNNELRMMVNKRTILIGICSGIAGYKIVDLIKQLKNQNIDTKIILTRNAEKMFGRKMFEEASGGKIYADLIPRNFNYKDILIKREVEHIKLADSANLFIIAPATANIIGKIGSGIADDLLTTTIMATMAPVVFCPSMNVHMWENPIVQENINKLKSKGYIFIEPDSGKLACGYEGVGRLADVKKIGEEIIKILKNRDRLKGKKIMITAGGTSEAIDAVRFITNRGSGKMGAAIAQECKLTGAEVLLLKAKNSVTPGLGIKERVFESGKELEELIKKNIGGFDYIFHTAAVSDFIPDKKITEKIESNKKLVLNLKPTPKILHKIRSWNPRIKIIGFKAVYKKKEDEMIKIGLEKLKASRSDYIVVNDVGKKGIGFGTRDNEVYLISDNGLVGKIAKVSKREVARRLLEKIINL